MSPAGMPDVPLSSRNNMLASDMILRITGNMFKNESDSAINMFGDQK